MKQKILIVAGGYSNERDISLKTAKSVYLELKKNKKYIINFTEPDGHFIQKIKKFKPNIVFNLLHGRYGEDGYIQAILESQKVKYTHSGVLASSIAMDKEISKKIYIKNKILTPKYFKYNFKSFGKNNILKNVEKKLKFPVVIKPINEGSSVNVFICTKTNFLKNLNKLREYNEVLIERYIPGREIQVAILEKKN